ncbi:MAG: hypothetical protein ACHRXM_13465 [Isosphaerales bacterium]
MRNIEQLWLDHIQVTDAGLVRLKKLTGLWHLWLDGTQVTHHGVDDLQKGLPNVMTIEGLRPCRTHH